MVFDFLMRKRLTIFAFHALFWMAFMIVCRILFLIYNIDLTRQLTWGEISCSFLLGLRMDASTSGYILMFTGLLITLSVIIIPRILAFSIKLVNIVFLVASCIIVTADLELYRQWGFRMNSAPLFYFSKEGLQSAQPGTTTLLIFIMIALITISILVYLLFIAPRNSEMEKGNPRQMILLFVITALLFIPIRGSFTVAPINSGTVYFDKSKPFANHAGINVIWNFFFSLSENGRKSYPENFYNHEKTERLFSQMMKEPDSTVHILHTQKPNVIIIITESLTADVIEPLGGMHGITPNLTRLSHDGVLFDHMFATGDRTDKGVLGVLSAYPALPLTSTSKYPDKTRHLPFLPATMNQMGYHSTFVYGGDPDFANLKSYLITAGFQHLTSLDDFPSALNSAKWGVRDEYLFKQAESELDTTRFPFFKTILTLSSHEPFDVPHLLPVDNSNEESLFLNALHYTDQCIGAFVDWCSQQAWWNNTLIIIVADHGHRLPGNKPLESMKRFRIPMFWLGGAVPKDTVVTTIGSQTDIANTLLGQIDKFHPEFLFSRNLLAYPATSFAQYFYNNGYGYVDPTHYLVYDRAGKQFVRVDGVTPDSTAINNSKAYAQKLFTDYNQR